MKTIIFLVALALASGESKPSSIYHKGWTDFNKNGVKDVYEDPSKDVEDRIGDLLSKMTLEEKTCQLVTLYGCDRVLKDPVPTEKWKTRVWKDGIANIDEHMNGVRNAFRKYYDYIYPFSNAVATKREVQKWFVEQTRLGIPAEFSNEGIHGLTHGLATPLPAPIAMGSTWDRQLVFEAGEIVGHEAELLGYNSVYAPILDVARDQRWGRTVECYGEDPYLVARLGLQMASGIQKDGKVGAGLKHYAAYGVPKGGRDGNCRTDPHITPRELHELFLYPFREVVSKADPMVVMSSYNDWNGEPVSASHYFLTELLRDEYGFKGYVVSDSDAVEFVYNKHEVAKDYTEAIKQVLEAGLNVKTNFKQPEVFIEALRKGLADGSISEKMVDDRVREVLRVKFRMGLFDNPLQGDPKLADKEVGLQKTRDFVLRTGEESIVLLKNNGILPLDKKALKKVLVTGPLADESNYMASRYGPNGHEPVTMLRGIREYLEGSVEVVYEKGCEVVDKNWPESEIIPEPLSEDEKAGIRKAVDAAAGADVIIAVMGEDDKRTGESRSRTSLELPGRQRDLLMALYATGKPVVLVLVNGQPLTVNWENKYLPAIVETWFQSCLGGIVVARTLFGDYNPSGKLTVTFPKTVGQIEYNFPHKKGSHGYQHKSGPNGSGRTRVQGPLYPFGFGLSYTTFEYSGLSVRVEGPANASDFSDITVEATIRNSGTREGTEVVQLYVRDCVSSVVTYDSVLRGFERVSLKPGESKQVSFTLRPEDLRILDKNMKWTVEPGDFEIRIGASSEDIRLRKTVTLN